MLVNGGRYEAFSLSFSSPCLTSKSVEPEEASESDESKSLFEKSELMSSGERESSVVDDDELLSLSPSDEFHELPSSSFPSSSNGDDVVVFGLLKLLRLLRLLRLLKLEKNPAKFFVIDEVIEENSPAKSKLWLFNFVVFRLNDTS